MPRLIALVLVVMLPATSFAQAPSFELAVPQAAFVSEQAPPAPLYTRWWLWTAVGGSLAVGLGVVLAVIFIRPSAGPRQSDFPCGSSCNSWINPPAP